jgi:hypothetical protein
VAAEFAKATPAVVLEDDFSNFAGFVAAMEEEHEKEEESEDD